MIGELSQDTQSHSPEVRVGNESLLLQFKPANLIAAAATQVQKEKLGGPVSLEGDQLFFLLKTCSPLI